MVDFWGDVLLRESARNSKQRVVVTGGAGFRGPHLCERLVGEGHHVICVNNFQKGRRENVSALLGSGRFELIDHDIITPLGSRIPRFDQISNLACPASPLHYQADPVATTLICSLGTLRTSPGLPVAGTHVDVLTRAKASNTCGASLRCSARPT
jgi:UDP-glucuronate decarboxylase